MRGEQHVAGDDRLLGDGGPAAQAELGGDGALVHLGALGQPRLLGVLGDDAVERLHVLQRAAHDHRVVDALAVVGEDPDAGGGVVHRAQLGELLALQADGDGADRLHVAVAGLPAEPPDLLDDAGGVGDREGVGHGVDGGVAAEGGGAGAGEDGLGVLAAGLAQVGVEVDQAGQQDLPVGVDRRSAPSASRPVPTAAMRAPSISTSCGSPPRTFAPRSRVLRGRASDCMVAFSSVRGCRRCGRRWRRRVRRRRAAGTGRPCGW